MEYKYNYNLIIQIINGGGLKKRTSKMVRIKDNWKYLVIFSEKKKSYIWPVTHDKSYIYNPKLTKKSNFNFDATLAL